MLDSIALPPARICLGITGHRDGNPAFTANRAAIEASLDRLFATIDQVTGRQSDAVATTRLHALLAFGADMIAVKQALARGWEVTAPLPFGIDLNLIINAEPGNAAQAEQMRDVASRVRLLELAEQDGQVSALLQARLEDPQNAKAAQDYSTIIAERVATAGRLMIEQSDILLAIWDGVTPGAIGGTRHTMSVAVGLGTPVLWVNAAKPEQIALLTTPEELFAHDKLPNLSPEQLEGVITGTLNPPDADQNERAIKFHTEQWHRGSRRRFHAYRRVEALFGGNGFGERFAKLTQQYETPDQIAQGSGAAFLEQARILPGGEARFVERIEQEILKRFAWADGLSTYLSDAYRGGMVTNFLLSAMAIMVGVAYLPLASVDSKWPFALAEFLLLTTILAITATGQRKRWHGRWFETRRVAEYFRHAPIMLMLGVARASGRWPRGTDTGWPEFYAREVLCDVGLPSVRISQEYLRDALRNLLLRHATAQRIYHEHKAQRLTRVHHRLDRLSEWLFIAAVLSVATYLAMIGASAAGVIADTLVHKSSKIFTFLGVALPALGGAFAGIRYFGDFERFAAISEVTAEKLAAIEQRITTLLHAPANSLRYAQVAELAHAIDDVVVTEIENWQSVFGGKQIAVPV